MSVTTQLQMEYLSISEPVFDCEAIDMIDFSEDESISAFEECVQQSIEFTEYLFSINTCQQSIKKFDGDLGFLYIVKPVISFYANQLQSDIEELGKFPIGLISRDRNDLIASTLLPLLFPTLTSLVSRTLILELNVAKLSDKLEGNTSEQRYNYFIESLKDENTALSLLKEYPLMVYRVLQTINYWRKNCLDFLKRLKSDYIALSHKFCIDRKWLGRLVGIEGGMGDSHNKGKSVLIVSFECGKKVIYKPRSLELDNFYIETIDWLNNKKSSLQLKYAKIVAREKYGWVEFIEYKSCDSLAGIKDFYQRFGSQMAVFYIFNAGDMHFENIIANGCFPIFIDLETFCSPSIEQSSVYRIDSAKVRKFPSSVNSLSLLPRKVWGDDKNEGIDLSGIAAKSGTKVPVQAEGIVDSNTDSMRLEKRDTKLTAASHIPMLAAEEINPYDYCDEIITGFKQTYSLFFKFKEDVISSYFKANKRNNCSSRCLFRPTQYYGTFLNVLGHPDYLRDIKKLSELAVKMGIDRKHRTNSSFLSSSEFRDILRGDVPYFESKISQKAIHNSDGGILQNVFVQSGTECLTKKLDSLSDNDLNAQVWAIKASFITNGTTSKIQENTFKPVVYRLKAKDFNLSISIAHQIADEILKNAVDGNWMGVRTQQVKTSYGIGWVDNSFYDGRLGIALFLSKLHSVSPEERYVKMALTLVAEVTELLSDSDNTPMSIGGLDGLSGIAYCIANIAKSLETPELLMHIPKILELIEANIKYDSSYDVMSGSAGCILALDSIYKITKDESILRVVKECAVYLASKYITYGTGIGWPCMSGAPSLAGFAHGCAGNIAALYCASFLLNDKSFSALARRCWDYEQSLFKEDVGTWSDVRKNIGAKKITDSTPLHFPNAWCHGAPGIGLARLRMMDYLESLEDKHQAIKDTRTALKKTLSSNWSGSHSLCHGSFGNLELMLSSKDIIKDEKLEQHLFEIKEGLIEDILDNGIKCGSDFSLNEYGFMNGIAGVGYQLLRLELPNIVESVIALE